MEQEKDSAYYRGYVQGYLAGYREGIKDANNGVYKADLESDVAKLPIEVMELSTRAYNSLLRAGCEHISDVVEMGADRVATIRNIGAKTASEIAHWLDTHGLPYSAWNRYL